MRTFLRQIVLLSVVALPLRAAEVKKAAEQPAGAQMIGQAKKQSQITCIFPVLMAMKKGEDYGSNAPGGPGVHNYWSAAAVQAVAEGQEPEGRPKLLENVQLQEMLLADYFNKPEIIAELNKFSATELRGWVSRDAKELTRIAQSEGFNVPFNFGGNDLGLLAILQVAVKWLEEGIVKELTIQGRSVDGAKLTKGIEKAELKSYKYPIYRIQARPNEQTKLTDVVYLCEADQELRGFALVEKIDGLRAALKDPKKIQRDFFRESQLTFPVTKIDIKEELEWLDNLTLTIGGMPYYVSQAKQHAKFSMDEVGAEVEVAFGVTGVKGGEPGKITEPFYVWIERPGCTVPIVYVYSTHDSWRDYNPAKGKYADIGRQARNLWTKIEDYVVENGQKDITYAPAAAAQQQQVQSALFRQLVELAKFLDAGLPQEVQKELDEYSNAFVKLSNMPDQIFLREGRRTVWPWNEPSREFIEAIGYLLVPSFRWPGMLSCSQCGACFYNYKPYYEYEYMHNVGCIAGKEPNKPLDARMLLFMLTRDSRIAQTYEPLYAWKMIQQSSVWPQIKETLKNPEALEALLMQIHDLTWYDFNYSNLLDKYISAAQSGGTLVNKQPINNFLGISLIGAQPENYDKSRLTPWQLKKFNDLKERLKARGAMRRR